MFNYNIGANQRKGSRNRAGNAGDGRRFPVTGGGRATVTIGLLEVHISIPEAHSLKDKRQVIRSLKDRILNKMNVSVAETGRQDAWQFAELAFVTVAGQRDVVDKRLAGVSTTLQSNPRIVILDLRTEIL